LLTLPSILFGAFFALAVAWTLGCACLYRLPVPRTVTLAVGAAAESGLVFLLLLAGAGNRIAFVLVGVACVALLVRLRSRAPRLDDAVKSPADRVTVWLAAALLASYGVLYLVNAMAPEVEPDAAGYHLGLVSEYVRLGRFPSRVGFYEMMPQGLEMLFVPAFAFGRHSAAKLVHFAFLLATIPLLLRIGRRLELPDRVAWIAAIIYFCAPVVGVSGTSAYNDAALVFFVLATFYLLLVWRDTRDARYLVPAGITAGFCYAIKMPGILVLPLAVVFVMVEMRAMRNRDVLRVAAAGLVAIAPWALRAVIMSGNPVAPLFNGIFPNSHFHALVERQLPGGLGSLRNMPLWRAPYELAAGGRFGGIVGPVFLALPLGFLALRRRAGRLCWVAAVLLAVPWFWNSGTRFVMPALPFVTLALVMALPKPAAWVCLAVQAVACWPQVADRYDYAHIWRLHDFPWRAALRLESEHDYLWRRSDDYKIAQMLQHDTRPGERIFSLMGVATAYTDREVLEFWHSAQAERLTDALRMVSIYRSQPFFEVRAAWPPQAIWGLRVRLPRAYPAEWSIHDVMLFSGEYRIFNSPQWRLRAWPNVWEAPLAFDENEATRWRTWQPMRAGMYLQAEFDHAQTLSGAVMTSETPAFRVPFEFYARGRGGWRLLSAHPEVALRTLPDLRVAAANTVRDAGFSYILAATGNAGNAPLAAAMEGHAAEWGMEKAGYAGRVTLYRIGKPGGPVSVAQEFTNVAEPLHVVAHGLESRREGDGKEQARRIPEESPQHQ